MQVLIVDDEPITRAMLRATIERLTDDIQEASNGIEALRLARERGPDIVILDIIMPGVDGYEICYLIKTAPELQHTRVVILTTRGDAEGISTGREAFADAYLLKPFDPDELLGTIRKLHSGERGPFPTGDV